MDGFFGNVVMVLVWRNKLEMHVGGFDIVSLEGRDFVVMDLVFCDDALVLHTIKCASTGHNHSPLCFVFDWINPSGVAVNIVEEHLILVAAYEALRELASLVCVDHGFRLVDCYKDVALFEVWLANGVWKVGGACAGIACGGGFRLGGHYGGVCGMFCVADALELVAHVSLLSFL